MAMFTTEEVYVLARTFSQLIDSTIDSTGLNRGITKLESALATTNSSTSRYTTLIKELDKTKEQLHNYNTSKKILQRFAIPEVNENWNPPFVVTGGNRRTTRKLKNKNN